MLSKDSTIRYVDTFIFSGKKNFTFHATFLILFSVINKIWVYSVCSGMPVRTLRVNTASLFSPLVLDSNVVESPLALHMQRYCHVSVNRFIRIEYLVNPTNLFCLIQIRTRILFST